ncbi:unnamed protein product [Hermetia illucens]|uniref:Enhancer of split malpha protein n=1 Tax=Hermetia illucens TaxID=343691 RepID=A0A7R8Z236_HERIL|nr:uncharacterized protein LOC119660027 [Hermetia illucens]CAD7093156.1 unnamed protein product [Hermetia illucens]
MFADIKNTPSETIKSEEEVKMGPGRLRRILKRILRALSSKNSRKATTSMPNNIKDYANNVVDDYATVIQKAACDRSFLQSYYEIDPFSDEDPEIVEYESATDLLCEFEDVYYCYEEEKEVIIPVHYARTDAGTFFWTAAQNRYDDDLIQSLYCSTENQMAAEQWR